MRGPRTGHERRFDWIAPIIPSSRSRRSSGIPSAAGGSPPPLGPGSRNSSSVRNCSRRRSRFSATSRHGLLVSGICPPILCRVVDPRPRIHRMVYHGEFGGLRMMKLRHLLVPGNEHRPLAALRHDVLRDELPVHGYGLRLAAHTTCFSRYCQPDCRRSAPPSASRSWARGPGLRQPGSGQRSAPGFLRGDDAVPTRRHPSHFPAIRAGLPDADFPSGGMATDSEAGEFAVPEDRVLPDLQRLERPSQNRLFPEPRLAVRTTPFNPGFPPRMNAWCHKAAQRARTFVTPCRWDSTAALHRDPRHQHIMRVRESRHRQGNLVIIFWSQRLLW